MEGIFELGPLALAVIPLVLGLVAVVKSIGLPSRFAPLASIAIGAGLLAVTGAVWQVALIQGIVVGLAASGLWSGGKALANVD